MNTLLLPWNRALALLGGLLLAGCVTINVYFPEAAAQKAAQEIVEDIIIQKPASQSSLPAMSPVAAMIERMLSFVIGSAHAAEPDMNIDTAEIRGLRASMRDRYPSLQGAISSGAVGFAANGDLSIRDAAKLSLRDRAKVQKLVASENNDRAALYKAIAVANGNAAWEAKIRSIFAKQWHSSAPSGAWIESGGWKQK